MDEKIAVQEFKIGDLLAYSHSVPLWLGYGKPKEILACAMELVEDRDVPVNFMGMNGKTYRRFRCEWNLDFFDPETRKKELQKGNMGEMWGAKVVVTDMLPEDVVLLEGIREAKRHTVAIKVTTGTSLVSGTQLVLKDGKFVEKEK